ncbi:MAG: phosphoribosylglycinamide formyltransferase [Omnitrophica bacterium RIFCSPLOWO2_12_FULL_44_17]|uniref:Phosphoribosylglycinamide formyltransferase n=1 Tax=Candidatus Danuiimicrobium aquiferis TaxID=1801832 RepID=A0A1G1L248_9BACT|nr:MAG: phosphoribosylglycinamide formyltransferase [Omnitrophica bacterium RIFCSPHIGHO2_02_FULL_45_28]OGW90822.1 MAG: phosphoribosylglycinamide formyltransferase [Omnitrophica bacterium RIFCSPHIGHO2_12_FULL_44_12]OGW99227.1 MAG: phosphoribosylglycinamide formyltransferase [Omnitrophica bacterium RIFCSPLOWO2_12_FULL_44_17]OGX04697.1 MAG: phosphoribosylglycinamide formyltransferase [Omnitrophica bacterium RIFCSPLOWO2_02_FULL_44_11]
MKKRCAVFVSGSGTNMENIAKRAVAGELDCEIALVVCDHPEACAIERAKQYGIETFVIEREKFASKTEFETAIHNRLIGKKVEVIFLAGYMRILGAEFVCRWQWKILNIHPSLLPQYPGAHSIQDAFQAREKETGVTVHFVDEGVDSGPVILQRRVPILPDDTLESLEKKVHQTEYELYPEAIRLFLAGRLKVIAKRVLIS